MGPTLPLDQPALSGSRGRLQQQQSNSGNGTGSSKPAARAQAGVKSSMSRASSSFLVDVPDQLCLPAPGLSPLPSTSTMPLSLQQLGSAASSTDSLHGPASVHSNDGISRSYIARHHHANSQSSIRTDPSNSHTISNRGQVTLVHPDVTGAGRPSGISAVSGHAQHEYGRPAVSSTNSSSYGFKRNEPSPSIYSTSSARSTSSVNSLPPASESSLSASTVMYAHSDPKGKGKSTLTPTGPIAVSSKKRVPSAIEEAVRNLGLPPPGLVNASYLSVPAPRLAGGSPTLDLSRTASANTSATSDAASLSGTVASSVGSTSKDGQSLSSKKSAKSATSKTKKKKTKLVTNQPTVITTVIKASSSSKPTATSASTSASTAETKVKKKKKAAPLPTSSGRSPTIPPAASASAPAPTLSPAPSSPQPAARAAQTRPARNVRPVATPPIPTSNQTALQANTSNVPLHRPVAQAVPSRNRHLDESALLRRFPETSAAATSVSTLQASNSSAPHRNVAAPAQPNRSAAQAPPTTARPGSATSAAPLATEESSRDEPAPPPWSPPTETITLAFTPIHAYLSAYHDSVDQPAASTSHSTPHPPVPDSPPPAFRSRSPSPEAGPSSSRSDTRRTSLSSSDNASLPDVDLDALEERSRGYASSENEIELLNSQGRHSGTSTPPADNAHGESTKGLRWQLRHWEAWRREGVSLEDRLQRLQQWSTTIQEQASLDSSSATTLARPIERIADVSHTAAAAAPQTPPATVRLGSARLEPSPLVTPVERQASPARSDLSHPAGSGVSQPRFPSVGTVRRARLQRFEAERQHTKSMSAVVQNSPATSSVGLPRQGSATKNHQAPGSVPPSASTNVESESSREQVRLAMLQAALDRHATVEATSVEEALAHRTQVGDDTGPSQPSGLVETVMPAIPPTEQAESSTSTSEPSTESELAKPTHQLARQLAAEIEAKRTSTASEETSHAHAGCQRESMPGESTSSTSRIPPAFATPPESHSPSKVKTAASRISRIFRPNMGPRPQPARKAVVEEETSVTRKPAPSEAPQPEQSTTLPVMTLPKAPPRLTTDPLSTDNLRKLSRRQLRPPSVHGAASASSSSSEDESRSPSTSEDQNSDSGSDSADDESTKKPPSTISHIGPRAPPSAVSTVYAHDSEREAAAASWRRTEDGRRHSAILSRPLSIKRKPPPVPPKRWGGVWDRDAIQERLRRSFNLLDDDEQASPASDSPTRMQGSRALHSARQVMPGTLATVAEDEKPWEVVGQDTAPTASTSSASWEVVGQNEASSSNSDNARFFARAQATGREFPSTSQYQHMYSEADFSNSRRLPPPPPPRFPPASPDLTSPASTPSEREADSLPPASISPRPSPAMRSSLQRTSAVRRPQSMMGPRQRAYSSESNTQALPENVVRSSPPSPEVRSRLSTRPRHVYSASVPNAELLQTQQPPTVARRPLPPLPPENNDFTPRSLPRSERMSFNTVPSVAETVIAPDASASTPVQNPVQEYTDLEVMLASMDDRAPGSVSVMSS